MRALNATERIAPSLGVLVLLAVAACAPETLEPATADPTPGAKADDPAGKCEGWSQPRALGSLGDKRAAGISGLVISPRRPSVVWAVNDATGSSKRRLFAIDRRGAELETYALPGAARWVDLATDGDRLYVMEESVEAGTLRVLSLPEPDPRRDEDDDPALDETVRVELHAPADLSVQAMFADGDTLSVVGEVDSRTSVLQVPLPLQDGAVLQPVLEDLEAGGQVVAASSTVDGHFIAMKVRNAGVAVWSREQDVPLRDVLRGVSCEAPGAPGPDRAIAIEAGGRGYLLAPDPGQGGGTAVLFAGRRALECPEASAPIERGTVQAPSATELSGLAVSRRNPGVLWAHNDGSREDPRTTLIALGHRGEHLADFTLSGAVNEDWEDIAIGPREAGGEAVIYIADIGDNERERDEVRLIRIAEPRVDAESQGEQRAIDAHEEIVLRYPDHPHNAEALAVDPRTGDVLVITKRGGGDEKTEVFVAEAPLHEDVRVVLERVAKEAGERLDARFVAADFAPAGAEMFALFAQVDGGDTLAWRIHPEESPSSALSWPPCQFPAPALQIESLAVSGEGRYWLVAEGDEPSLFEVSL